MRNTPQSFKQEFISQLREPELKQIAEKLLAILSFPDGDSGLAEALVCLAPVLECLRSILPCHKTKWKAWYEALPHLIECATKVANAIYASTPERSRVNSKLAKRKRWSGTFEMFPLLYMIVARADSRQEPHVLPMKAILFASQALKKEGDSPDKYFSSNCQAVRRGHDKDNSISSVLAKFPAWYPGLEDWEQQIDEFSQVITYSSGRRGKYGSQEYPSENAILVGLKKRYIAIREAEEHLSKNATTHILNLETPFEALNQASSGSYTHTSGSVLDVITAHAPNDHIDQTANAPKSIRVQQRSAVSTEQASPSIRSEQQETKYSNFRTKSQKQFLPWAWEVLNPIEIERLLHAIISSAESHKIGTMLSWIGLFTGMPFDDICTLALCARLDNKPGIDSDGNWCRVIPSPEYSFKPDTRQQRVMEKHADYVHLALPQPRPALLHQLLHSVDPQTNQIKPWPLIKDASPSIAANNLRNFLVDTRLANHGRYTPGRIQKTLAHYVMRETGDPILVHLITGMRTDLPPVGAYYASYDVTLIQEVYLKAVNGILNT